MDSFDVSSMVSRSVKSRQRLVFFVSEDWYFCSHRLPLAISAKKAGYDVYVITRVTSHAHLIRESDIKLIPIVMTRRINNLFSELQVIIDLVRIYREIKPDIVHNVAIKPVVYGSIATLFTSVPLKINALAGLGFIFTSKSQLARFFQPVIQIILKILLGKKNTYTIVQNSDDKKLLVDRKIIHEEKLRLIMGSGVNMDIYKPEKNKSDLPVVMMAGRMLWDKGVGEFVRVARKLTGEGIRARFILVGSGDADNPSSISSSQLRKWQENGDIEWWGARADMPDVFKEVHIVCLPTIYGEGVPKVLIEAAASALPIVANDVSGCREIVRQGENGMLVPPLDPQALSDALISLIGNKELREKMGTRGREIVQKEFSEQKVIGQTMEMYEIKLSA